jgi:hypothetical protein
MAARVDDGEDVAAYLASEQERIEAFLALEVDAEFEAVSQLQDVMRTALLLYLDGCSEVAAGNTDAARTMFLEGDRLMRQTQEEAVTAVNTVWQDVQEGFTLEVA